MDPSPKAKLRTLRAFLGGLCLLALLTLVAAYAWTQREAARWPSLSETPPVAAPTQPQRGDGRAFDALMAALGRCPLPLPDLADALDAQGDPGADARSEWQPLLPCVTALRAAQAQTRGLSVPQPASLDAAGPDLLPFLRLTRAWLLQAWSLAADAPSEGLREMLAVRELGLRFVRGDSGLVGVMLGLAISGTASRELFELLATHGPTTPALYAQAAEGLTPIEPGAVARALAVEARLIEGMLVQQLDTLPTLERLGCDEELTRVWQRQSMQRAVDRAAQPRWERGTAPPEAWETGGGVLAAIHNPTGRTLLSIATPSYERLVAREDAAVASARLDALELALRRYALDHEGALPTDQAALVPDYLPAAQVDPFDGEPLRLAERSAWSVGETHLEPSDSARLRRAL